MTLSGQISTKNSKSPRKSSQVRDGLRSRNKVNQNIFKNTPEDGLDTFCNIISHLTAPRSSLSISIFPFNFNFLFMSTCGM